MRFLTSNYSRLVLACAVLMAVIIVGWPFLLSPTDETDPTYGELPASDDRDIPPSANLLFVGDVMLARGVEWRILQEGIEYPLGDMKEFLSGYDATIGNFEGTYREAQFVENGGVMTFDTTRANVDMLADVGFDFLSIANNHGDDYGPAVTQSTRETIVAAGMTPFGDPNDGGAYIARTTINGINISLIGWHAFGEYAETIVDDIAAEKAAGQFVIVYPHWGPEYQAQPHQDAEVVPGHMFVDAGADIVIGAHPHVIQTIETYNDAPIIYSLGNFLFDQDFSVETMQGLTLGLEVTDTEMTLTFHPVGLKKQKTTLMSDEDAAAVLARYDLPATMTIPRK